MSTKDRKLKLALGVLVGTALDRDDVRQVVGLYYDHEVSGYHVILEPIDPGQDEAEVVITEDDLDTFKGGTGLDSWVAAALDAALGEEELDEDGVVEGFDEDD